MKKLGFDLDMGSPCAVAPARAASLATAAFLGLVAAACSPPVEAAGAAETAGAAGTGEAGGAMDTGGSGGTGGATSTGGTGGTGHEPCVLPPDPAVFEVGTGTTCFERLTPMQVVPVNKGSQGGFHVWLGVGCKGCTEDMFLRYGIKDPMTDDYFPDGFPLVSLWYPFTHDPATGWETMTAIADRLPGSFKDASHQLPKGTHILVFGEVLDAPDGMVLHSQEIEVELGDVVE